MFEPVIAAWYDHLMQPNIYFLAAGFRTSKQESLLRTVFSKSIKAIQSALPLRQAIDVVFQVDPFRTIPEVGIGGYTPNGHTVYISLDPNHRQFLRSVKKILPRTLAHELHHAIRWKHPGYGRTLGEALVSEGLAAHFELEVFGGQPNSWDIAVRGKKLQDLYRRARPEFIKSSYDHQAWFFGSVQRHIPRWAGYSVGYLLLKQYLQSPSDDRPSMLVHIPAAKILS